jgi:hypothetical protein
MKISETNSTYLTRIFLESLKKHCISRYDLFCHEVILLLPNVMYYVFVQNWDNYTILGM